MNDHKESRDYLLGDKSTPIPSDIQNDIAWSDHKIKFCVSRVKNKSVLDIGCVQHNPENYRSRYWLHKALVVVAKSVIGIDLYESGVIYLNKIGYSVQVANAEHFDLGKKFDVIVAGDIIEHLNNVGGFFESVKNSLYPDGEFLISTPNPWYWRNVVKAALMSRVKPNPEHTLWMPPLSP